MSKGQTKTTNSQVPDWENADWQNLLGQTNQQTNADISSVDYPGVQDTINKNTANIGENTVNAQPLEQGIAAAGNASFTDPGVASQFINPYTSTALASQVNLDRSSILNPELANADVSAASSNALGGDRSAVLKSQLQNNFNNTEANTISQGINTAYTQGQNAYETEAARKLAGTEAIPGVATSVAGSNINTNLAGTQNTLSGIAASEAPEQQLATESSVLGQLPNQGTTTQTETPNGGIWGGIASGLVGGAGQLLKSFGGSGSSDSTSGGKEGGLMDDGEFKRKKTRRLKKKGKR